MHEKIFMEILHFLRIHIVIKYTFQFSLDIKIKKTFFIRVNRRCHETLLAI